MSTPLTPNVKRLILHKMSHDAIPSEGGIGDALRFLTTPGAMNSGWRKAAEWVAAAIRAVREAGEPNPWKVADDEAIAGELLRKIDERKASRGQHAT